MPMRAPPDKERGRLPRGEDGPDTQQITATNGEAIIADARGRVRAQNEHLRVCRHLHRVAPLTRYYGPRPLWAVPLGELPRWRWAA
jgi:hypothetical protein